MNISRMVIDKEKERLANMICPKCGSKSGEVGSMTIQVKGNEEASGHHCAHCYALWIAENVPKFVDAK